MYLVLIPLSSEYLQGLSYKGDFQTSNKLPCKLPHPIGRQGRGMRPLTWKQGTYHGGSVCSKASGLVGTRGCMLTALTLLPTNPNEDTHTMKKSFIANKIVNNASWYRTSIYHIVQKLWSNFNHDDVCPTAQWCFHEDPLPNNVALPHHNNEMTDPQPVSVCKQTSLQS